MVKSRGQLLSAFPWEGLDQQVQQTSNSVFENRLDPNPKQASPLQTGMAVRHDLWKDPRNVCLSVLYRLQQAYREAKGACVEVMSVSAEEDYRF